jgi:hypothetical protein
MLNSGLPLPGADETSPGKYDNNAANENMPDGRSYAARAITKDLVDQFKQLPSRPGQPTLNQPYAALLDCKADTGIPLVTQHNVNVVVALHSDHARGGRPE